MQTNNWTRSTGKREPAEPQKPVVDPAGWLPGDYAGSDRWIYHLSSDEIAEIRAAVAGVEARGLDIKDIARDDFPLPTLATTLSELQDEVMDGRGFVLVRGLPMGDMTRAQAAAAFWGVGANFGQATPQNAKGHVLGHVKDLGQDYSDAEVRGYLTRAHMNFHADQADILGLGCLHPAKSGGAHRICSSVSLHNEMLRRRPDLAKELGWKFYWTRHGEIPPGEDPYYRMAVFTFHDGYFTARGVSAHIAKGQTLSGVPKFTPAQLEAMEFYKEIALELSMDIKFQQGDMSFVQNHVMLHSRTAFEDWPEPDRKRHILRLWLTTHGRRPLPPEFAQQMVGIRVEGATLTAPLDAE